MMKKVELKSIGARLQAIRKKLDMRQKDFAQELEVSGASLSEIEAGNLKPSFEVYYNLTKKFSVDIYYLLHGMGEMFVNGGRGVSDGLEKKDEYDEFIETFLKYFKASPMVRYTMMTHFIAFLIEKEHTIKKDKKKTGGQDEKP